MFRKGWLACLCGPVILLFGSGDHLTGTTPLVGLVLNQHMHFGWSGVVWLGPSHRWSELPLAGILLCGASDRRLLVPSTFGFHLRPRGSADGDGFYDGAEWKQFLVCAWLVRIWLMSVPSFPPQVGDRRKAGDRGGGFRSGDRWVSPNQGPDGNPLPG